MKKCTCPIRPGMTFREAMDEILPIEGPTKNCCRRLGYICPDLDRFLVALRKEEKQKTWASKARISRLREKGIPEEDIMQEIQKPSRKRRTKVKSIKSATIDYGSF